MTTSYQPIGTPTIVDVEPRLVENNPGGLSRDPVTRAYQIVFIVFAVILVVGIIGISVAFAVRPPKAINTSGNAYQFRYSQAPLQAQTVNQNLPSNFSVWSFTFNGNTAIECDAAGNLTLVARAWNINKAQQWTCGLRQGFNILDRGIYVIQNLQFPDRCLCSVDNSDIPTTCTPVDTGNPRNRFVMLRITSNSVATQVVYAIVNQLTNKALAVDKTTNTLIYKDQNASDQSDLVVAELIPLPQTVLSPFTSIPFVPA